MSAQNFSRFLDEIPTQLAQHHDASSWSTMDAQRYYAQWLGIQSTPNSNVLTFSGASSQKQSIEHTKTMSNSAKAAPTWKRNQPVIHATFGTGIIQSIEPKDGTTYLTIAFKGGSKKIDAKFVKML